MPGIRIRPRIIKIKGNGKWFQIDDVYIAVGPKKIPFKTTNKIKVRHTITQPPYIQELSFDQGEHEFTLPVHLNRIEVSSNFDTVVTWRQ